MLLGWKVDMRFLLTLVVLAGCSTGPAPCTEGATQACACDALDGTQTCKADGTFGACVCDEPCEPLTCEELGADCGPVDDGCDGTVQCGVCGDNATCLTNNHCVCDDGYVELDAVCLDDPCEPDPCQTGEVCTPTASGPDCDCAPGLVPAEGGGCEAPPDETDDTDAPG